MEYISRPSDDYLVIWLTRLRESIETNNKEWFASQEKSLREYPKRLKTHHYFELIPLRMSFQTHTNTLITLQDIFPLKIIKQIFTQICNAFRFAELDLLHPPIK